mgnify:CR=1 FL=1
MAAFRYLSEARIRAIHKVAVAMGLAESTNQETLLAGLDKDFLATLPRRKEEGAQLLATLAHLNETERLPDGYVPLASWLSNAIVLRSMDPQVKALEEALAALSPAAVPRPIEPPESASKSRRTGVILAGAALAIAGAAGIVRYALPWAAGGVSCSIAVTACRVAIRGDGTAAVSRPEAFSRPAASQVELLNAWLVFDNGWQFDAEAHGVQIVTGAALSMTPANPEVGPYEVTYSFAGSSLRMSLARAPTEAGRGWMAGGTVTVDGAARPLPAGERLLINWAPGMTLSATATLAGPSHEIPLAGPFEGIGRLTADVTGATEHCGDTARALGAGTLEWETSAGCRPGDLPEIVLQPDGLHFTLTGCARFRRAIR